MSTKLTLNKAKLFCNYRIVNSHLKSDIDTRLSEMGLVRNASVKVIKTAPLGDPLEIELKGYKLCIRKTEAEHYEIVEDTVVSKAR